MNDVLLLPLPDLLATQRLAILLAQHVAAGEVLALQGDLGVGKTAFSRFFIQSLTSDATEVVSPTFILLQTYVTASVSLWHFDLYRLQSAAEAIELGIDEAFSEGVALIEWPEMIEAWLPKHRLSLHLSFTEGEQRQVRLEGFGNWTGKLRLLAGALQEHYDT
jgi:tRNA threonylcarbamoyladenosine biosynthesis protein TsaE